TEEPEGPGRPRSVYDLRPGLDRGGSRDYRLLARVLLGRFASGGPRAAEEARDAGRAWGRHLVEAPAPYQRVTADQARGRLTGVLSDLGFAPEPVPDDPDWTLHLRHCPFLELAEEYGGVVCPLHLGLMQGALDELGAPIAAGALEPFGARDACVVRLEPVGAGPRSGSDTDSRSRQGATEGM
ncbi:MAG: helix-turn-helix transcriptional regulator, partial [Actinocrinis sp.]